jgi:cytochrome c oxidase subunit III
VTGYAVERRELPAAWWGMAMFIAGETTLFAIMTGSYFYLRVKNVEWPPAGIAEPKVVVPLVLLGVILLSVAPIHLGYAAARSTRLGPARAWIVLALVLQAGYFAMQVHEYAGDLSRFTPQAHAYGSIYFTLLGADHAHVALGLLFDVWLLLRPRFNAFLVIAFYWYAVAAITAVVTLTVMSPAL